MVVIAFPLPSVVIFKIKKYELKAAFIEKAKNFWSSSFLLHTEAVNISDLNIRIVVLLLHSISFRKVQFLSQNSDQFSRNSCYLQKFFNSWKYLFSPGTVFFAHNRSSNIADKIQFLQKDPQNLQGISCFLQKFLIRVIQVIIPVPFRE